MESARSGWPATRITNVFWWSGVNAATFIAQRLRQGVVINAGSMVGTTVVGAGFGVVFWWFAAHQYPPAAVGLAAAAVSAMTMLGTLGVLGFGTLLIGELPRHGGKGAALVATALDVTS